MGIKKTTPVGRFSFVNVFTPRSRDGGKARYECTLLLDKGDPATEEFRKFVGKATVQLAKEKWPKFFETAGSVKEAMDNLGIKPPIKDGDGSDGVSGQGERLAGMAGNYFIRTSRREDKGKPHVVDANVEPILNQSEVYSGAYGRISVDMYAFEHSGNRGVTFDLCNVQKSHDGEPLGGGGQSRAEDDFGKLSVPGTGADDPPNYGGEEDEDDWM